MKEGEKKNKKPFNWIPVIGLYCLMGYYFFDDPVKGPIRWLVKDVVKPFISKNPENFSVYCPMEPIGFKGKNFIFTVDYEKQKVIEGNEKENKKNKTANLYNFKLSKNVVTWDIKYKNFNTGQKRISSYVYNIKEKKLKTSIFEDTDKYSAKGNHVFSYNLTCNNHGY